MGIITVEQIVTADGFAAQADGGLDFFGAFDTGEDRTDRGQLEWLESVDAILLGRRTYEMFAGFWPTADPAVEAVATWINDAPKHVVSGTLDRAPWGEDGEAEVHRDGPLAAATDLRARYGSVVVWGSLDLTDALFAARAVDVLRLRTVPVMIGAGRSFAPPSLGQQRLDLDTSAAQSTGHVATQYRVRR
ncbi:dihydrofolate reductase family protein [Nocardioides zhouii]|uniref:Bacterial bifunctional deaminase-reductase C-terminal domain-containing protein n=1 Tax=Nocardioides zhouii TaxID=1168729 RepID=A0A4Q2SND5_9ACTN|nr:dihydrofolate reductase family protein [Nocardioides zhouii]RYC05704.1 hypothetical protein EUA94_17540 [Nocardioides zhouii]